MPKLLDEMYLEFVRSDVDYMSNCLKPTFPDGLDIEIFNNIDLSSEMRDSMQEINTFESQYPNYEAVLYNTSRKQDDVRAKKAMRTNLISRLLPYQRRMHEKVLAELDRLAGILGEYEGLVIKVKNSQGEPFIFKVISPTFHKNKGRI
jgi:hypothetical protein